MDRSRGCSQSVPGAGVMERRDLLTYMSIGVFKSDAGSTVESVLPPFCILTADRHKVLLCLIGRQLGETAVAACRVVPVRGHLSMVVVDLVLQAASRCRY